jgi:predicted DNA binding CopG/RHH family protein
VKIYKLDKEEKEIIKAVYRGEYQSISDPEKAEAERQKYIQYAKNTKSDTLKNKRINIRINETDLNIIKTLAKKEGLPYQTYIGSTLHKIAMSNHK